MDKTERLARDLVDCWTRNYTVSGRLGFLKVDQERLAILDEAEALGIRENVYDLANKIMNGDYVSR